ncbi:conserved exported hypothetical protein [Candidatus Methylobacter favarea]|uniref:Uncharacterized protein n=1 Tax=Candidatus Methylobacter favarea TaxID=2707345 RepID=A0A8S0X983_9GAMM|nr:hypothetical protein [Candidatus Methylobacter favarea]CAA9891966.1 conserved exported hypothetical protein [Candidatus Methylobacter favarea]
MQIKSTLSLIGLLSICSCAWNNATPTTRQQNANVISGREGAVSLYSLIHNAVRDTERASYKLMYGIRDGVDSVIYDGEKAYYENYQK